MVEFLPTCQIRFTKVEDLLTGKLGISQFMTERAGIQTDSKSLIFPILINSESLCHKATVNGSSTESYQCYLEAYISIMNPQ